MRDIYRGHSCVDKNHISQTQSVVTQENEKIERNSFQFVFYRWKIEFPCLRQEGIIFQDEIMSDVIDRKTKLAPKDKSCLLASMHV